MIFKAKDEKDTSMMQILYTKPVKLEITETHNNLVEVRQGGERVLSENDLLYSTNAPSGEIVISYEVLDIPELGEFLFFNDLRKVWEPAEFFSQQDINNGKVKYVHDISKNQERFKYLINHHTIIYYDS